MVAVGDRDMKLKDIKVSDLYDLEMELDKILKSPHFNSTPFAYRTGVRRMRTYLDHVASGLRMIKGGRYEPHDIQNIHKHNKDIDYGNKR